MVASRVPWLAALLVGARHDYHQTWPLHASSEQIDQDVHV